MIVLGLDPGLANTGWGIIEFAQNRYRYIAHGCITTASSACIGTRLEQIFKEIESVIISFKPSCAGIETLYFAKNRTSALAVAQARGVLLLLLQRYSIIVKELTPNQIKQAVSGFGAASKEGVGKMVQFLLGLDRPPTPDHSSDALASAIAYTMYQNSL